MIVLYLKMTSTMTNTYTAEMKRKERKTYQFTF